MIYFIKNPETNFVKIGYSGNVKTRIRTLKEKHGKNLELVFLANGGRDTEKKIHKKYSEFRQFGEWFLWDERVREEETPGLVPVNETNNKETCSLCLTAKTWEMLRAFAIKDRRTLSNAAEVILSQHLWKK